jgi:N-acetyltransferase
MAEKRALGPVTLEGRFVRLEPLREEHREALLEAAQNLDWGWFLHPLRTAADVDFRINLGLEAERQKEGYAFAVRSLGDNRIVGSTSYFGVVQEHKRVEIGSTWYTSDVQGTAVNPECKYLLLGHAFDDWGANRVQFTTDSNNVHSQRAIEKLGAKREGVLRGHAIRGDGSIRDSVVYSIVRAEWPAVRRALNERLSTFGVGQKG